LSYEEDSANNIGIIYDFIIIMQWK